MNRTAWGMQQYYCFRCGETRGLETHEIARGVFRQAAVKEPAAWLRLCNHCHHGEIHDKPKYWTIARQLALKLLHDPKHYDREKVNEIRSLGESTPNRVTEKDVAIALHESLQRHEVHYPE